MCCIHLQVRRILQLGKYDTDVGRVFTGIWSLREKNSSKEIGERIWGPFIERIHL
jgi:hypothetical protein